MSGNLTKECINSITLFGLDFHLLYKKEKKYSTNFDICLSFLFLIFFISISIIYIKELLDTSNMTVIRNDIPIKNKEAIDLSFNPIIIEFSNASRLRDNLDNSYISMKIYKVQHNIINYRLVRIQDELEYEICNISNFPKNFSHSFQISNNSYCLKKGQNLTIAGRYGDFAHGFDIIEIHFFRCQNSSTSKTICKSEKEINDLVSNSYIMINYLTWSIDHLNVSNPINPISYSELFVNSLGTVKRYFYYFSPSVYNSDHGLILNSNKVYQFYEFKNKYLDFIEKENSKDFSENTFFECIFTVYPQKNIYQRKYIKIQDVIGNIGGCLDFICIILKFISFYFSEKSFLIEFSNTLMDSELHYSQIRKRKQLNTQFSVPDKNKTRTHLATTDKPLENNFFKFKKSLTIVNNETKLEFLDKKDFNNTFKNNKLFYERKLKLSIFDYFIPFFVMEKCKKKNIIYCYENIFKKYLSIEVMIPLMERSSIPYIHKDSNSPIRKKKGFFFKFDPLYF